MVNFEAFIASYEVPIRLGSFFSGIFGVMAVWELSAPPTADLQGVAVG
jgi:hypothetical protein